MRAVILIALLGGVAFADKRAASQHFQQGSQLYADGKWADALEEFQAGYDAYPLRGFLVNIGQCYRKLERLEEAADTWKRFLATHPSDARLRAEVSDALAEVEAAIRARAPETAPPVQTVVPPPPEEPARASASDIPALALTATPPPIERKKSRAWVWAVVGVTVASVAAVAVTVGVVEYQNSTPHAGSLGLLDGRR